MSYDELELDRLGDEKSALFFLISDTDTTYNFIVALAFSQMFNLLCERADNKYGGRLPYHVRVLWDEAANTGQVPSLEKIVAVIRSREISLTLFYQAMSQCKALYKDNSETIMGNMDSIIFLGGREASTLKDISENWLGKATISMQTEGRSRGQSESYSQNMQRLGRELMTPDEVRNMSNKKCLIFIKGFNPIFDDKYIPFRHKNFSQTEDGGGKAYVHDPSLNQESLRPVKLLSEKQINDIKEYKKENEVVHIMDMSLEEIMMLDDTKRLYFENSNESESSGDEGSAKTISRTDILENMTEQELMDEITNRMCMMDFSREQIEEITKSLDAHMKLSILLSYLYPTTSAEEMAKKRNEHLSKRD